MSYELKIKTPKYNPSLLGSYFRALNVEKNISNLSYKHIQLWARMNCAHAYTQHPRQWRD
jgi:hypothetical protein